MYIRVIFEIIHNVVAATFVLGHHVLDFRGFILQGNNAGLLHKGFQLYVRSYLESECNNAGLLHKGWCTGDVILVEAVNKAHPFFGPGHIA